MYLSPESDTVTHRRGGYEPGNDGNLVKSGAGQLHLDEESHAFLGGIDLARGSLVFDGADLSVNGGLLAVADETVLRRCGRWKTMTDPATVRIWPIRMGTGFPICSSVPSHSIRTLPTGKSPWNWCPETAVCFTSATVWPSGTGMCRSCPRRRGISTAMATGRWFRRTSGSWWMPVIPTMRSGGCWCRLQTAAASAESR